ncbi:MAG: hypothetical protein HS114_10970 [Anaerolineales bacterium]|nr:hypothetical protein [Anaerolineales bacterium]
MRDDHLTLTLDAHRQHIFRKLKNSTVAPYVEVEARLERETEQRLVEVYKL